MRPIDADALIAEYPDDVLTHCDIEATPTIDARPVVHGKWIRVPSSDLSTGKAYKCSECEKMRYGAYLPNYCQCCGAKMDKEVNEK